MATITPSGSVTSEALIVTRTYTGVSVEDVWSALTTSEGLAPWYGTYEGDPASGTVQLTLAAEGESTTETVTIRECEAPQRLGVTTGSAEDPWVIDVEVAEGDAGVTVTLAHAITDVEMIADCGPGWEYYLDRLGAALEGADAEAVAWDDYYPSQKDYYRSLAADAQA